VAARRAHLKRNDSLGRVVSLWKEHAMLMQKPEGKYVLLLGRNKSQKGNGEINQGESIKL
jgi:hypothetical protein